MSSKSDIVRRRTLSPEALRFADLVRAREIQQEKLRDALLHQNSDLRRKLEETSPPRQNSTDPNVTPLRHEDASPAPAAQSTGSGDRGSAASAAATSVAGHVNAGVALDYAYLIQTMRDMIAKSQDAQLTALAQHEAAIAHRFEAMQRSVDDLHEAMHRDETQRAILREEQTQQYLELSAEVDKLREDLTRRGSDDIVKKEVAANLLAVEADLSRMSARISAIEELPRHFRDEFASMEERFASLSATIASDRNAAIQARNDVAERHELEVQAILKNAEDTLARVVSAASSCELQAADAQASLGIKVQESVSRLAESLEAEILARMEEQAEKVSQVAQRQAMEFQSMQVEIHNSLGEVKASVESSLLGMRRQYHDAVQEQLRSVVQQAEEFERQRRAECPVADSDRVDLMVAELQGAAVMLEGILANAASQQRHDPKIPGRIDGLEAKLAGLEARLEHIADPSSSGEPLRICVTVPVQTEAEFKSGGGTSEVTPSVEEKVTHRVQRHLADELDKAADEIRLASARKVLARLTASPPATSRAMVESHAAAAPQPTPTLALTQSQSLPRYPQAVSARGASTHDYESLSLEEVRQKLASKEAALVKVQTILRNILATFHAVSEQEELHGDSWSKEKIEEVIRQKHEMYTRERQLVDQRNVLMKDIAELQSVERRLSLN